MTDLTEEQRRETLIDTWASWSLSGFVPSEDDRRYAQAYISGTMTLEQIRQQLLARFPQVT